MAENKNTAKLMFTGLPSFVYIVVAWTGYWYTIYAYGLGQTYYNWYAM